MRSGLKKREGEAPAEPLRSKVSRYGGSAGASPSQKQSFETTYNFLFDGARHGF